MTKLFKSESLWPMGFEVVDIQPTPNPNATKFVLSGSISEAPTSFFNAESANHHPIAAQLFAIAGVESVLLLGDFVTVNKLATARWDKITPRVREILKNA